jgi:hypothetical protein
MIKTEALSEDVSAGRAASLGEKMEKPFTVEPRPGGKAAAAIAVQAAALVRDVGLSIMKDGETGRDQH